MSVKTLFSLKSLTFTGLCLIAGCEALPVSNLQGLATVPLERVLECIPEQGALIAAHRGTSRGGRSTPENSLSGLESLIASGVVMAEIDVARTRDGVHILYHDGVWEDGSNGKGAVAATEYPTVKTFSLRDREGRLSADGIPTLREYIARAKDRVFLEIDFKSSADYAEVIEIIENYDMSDRVVLIAYTEGQARALRRLSPTAFISIPAGKGNGIAEPTLTWLGGDIAFPDGYAIGRIGTDRHDAKGLQKLRAYDIAVTDYALSEPPVSGLTFGQQRAFQACVFPSSD